MTVFILKLIAMASMLIDHITYCFVPNDTAWYIIGRGIGRLAFPIFCYLIVEGMNHTRCTRKYILRLLLAAVVSEVFFDMTFYKTFFYPDIQNSLWTLLIGLVACVLLNKLKMKYYPFKSGIYAFYGSGVILAATILSMAIGAEYGMFGVLLIIAMFYFRDYNRVLNVLAFGVLLLAFYGLSSMLEMVGVLAFVPICFYNGEKGRDDHHLFYLFYPGHLMILGILVMFVFA